MPYIIFCAILIVLVYYLSMRYEKRFVRSFVYLEAYEKAMQGGATEEAAIAVANEAAFTIFSYASDARADKDAVYRAKAHAALHYNKKQRPLIKKALSMGFFG